MGNSPSPWRGSTGIPKPFLFPLFSFGPHPPILPEVSDPPWHGERLLASESRCAEQETTFGPDDRKQEGAATDPPPPPQSPQETVLYSRHRVQRPAHSPLPQTVAPWWVFFSLSFRSSVSSRVTRPADQREKNKHEPAAVAQREISDGLFTQKDISIIQLFHLFSHGVFDTVQMKMRLLPAALCSPSGKTFD